MALHHLAKFHFDSGNLDVVSDGPVMSFRGFTVRIGEGAEPGEVGVQIIDHNTRDIFEYGKDGGSIANLKMGDLTEECRRSLEFAVGRWRNG